MISFEQLANQNFGYFWCSVIWCRCDVLQLAQILLSHKVYNFKTRKTKERNFKGLWSFINVGIPNVTLSSETF